MYWVTERFYALFGITVKFGVGDVCRNPVVELHPPGRLASSVGWVPDCRAGGQGFEPWPDQHSGS